VVFGVQFVENSGVVEEKKKVIAIESMPVILVEDIDIEELVALAIDMADVVLVDVDTDVDIDIEPIELVVDISMANDQNG
jgi:hypothetical protein